MPFLGAQAHLLQSVASAVYQSALQHPLALLAPILWLCLLAAPFLVTWTAQPKPPLSRPARRRLHQFLRRQVHRLPQPRGLRAHRVHRRYPFRLRPTWRFLWRAPTVAHQTYKSTQVGTVPFTPRQHKPSRRGGSWRRDPSGHWFRPALSQHRPRNPSASLPPAHQTGNYNPVPAHPRHGFGNLGRTALQKKSQAIRHVHTRGVWRRHWRQNQLPAAPRPAPPKTRFPPVTSYQPSTRARARHHRATNRLASTLHSKLDSLEQEVRSRVALANGYHPWPSPPRSPKTLSNLSNRITTINRLLSHLARPGPPPTPRHSTSNNSRSQTSATSSSEASGSRMDHSEQAFSETVTKIESLITSLANDTRQPLSKRTRQVQNLNRAIYHLKLSMALTWPHQHPDYCSTCARRAPNCPLHWPNYNTRAEALRGPPDTSTEVEPSCARPSLLHFSTSSELGHAWPTL